MRCGIPRNHGAVDSPGAAVAGFAESAGTGTVIPSLLATQLDLPADARSPIERVKGYLSDRQLLLLLDNVEHLLPGAVLVAEILESCPEVKVPARLSEVHPTCLAS